MKYLSIDIETSGLDPNQCEIIELGAVLDSLGEYDQTPVYQLPYFRAVVVQDRYNLNPYCALLHARLWAELEEVDKDRVQEEGSYLGRALYAGGSCNISEDLEVDKPEYERYGVLTHYCQPSMLLTCLFDWLAKYYPIYEESIYAAGKNFGAFDLQFLKTYLQISSKPLKDHLPFKHRFFDPGCMYFRIGDTEIPNLQTCVDRAEIKQNVDHSALGDARLVATLIRKRQLGY